MGVHEQLQVSVMKCENAAADLYGEQDRQLGLWLLNVVSTVLKQSLKFGAPAQPCLAYSNCCIWENALLQA